jgi:hypothetical protein
MFTINSDNLITPEKQQLAQVTTGSVINYLENSQSIDETSRAILVPLFNQAYTSFSQVFSNGGILVRDRIASDEFDLVNSTTRFKVRRADEGYVVVAGRDLKDFNIVQPPQITDPQHVTFISKHLDLHLTHLATPQGAIRFNRYTSGMKLLESFHQFQSLGKNISQIFHRMQGAETPGKREKDRIYLSSSIFTVALLKDFSTEEK